MDDDSGTTGHGAQERAFRHGTERLVNEVAQGIRT